MSRVPSPFATRDSRALVALTGGTRGPHPLRTPQDMRASRAAPVRSSRRFPPACSNPRPSVRVPRAEILLTFRVGGLVDA
jgi:hypothetical protein